MLRIKTPRSRAWIAALVLPVSLNGPALADKAPAPNHAISTSGIPLYFEANRGQAAPEALFLARGQRHALLFARDGMLLATDNRNDARLQMQVVDGSPDVQPRGENPLPGRSHYLRGNNPKRWLTNVPQFGALRYPNIYPGIDLVYYGNRQRLQYDFVLAPGADPARIKLRFNNARDIRVDAQGRLRIALPTGTLTQLPPVIYQERDGTRTFVDGGFAVDAEGVVGFALADYDKNRALIIDPVLEYSSYFGGSGFDSANAVAVDAAGNIIVSGVTASLDFPLAAPLQGTHAGPVDGNDMFIAKFDPSGSTLLFSTYIGGSGDDQAQRMLVDNTGNPVLVGYTSSADFPVINAAQPVFGGGDPALFEPQDGFLLKLAADGSSLVFSTYIGGFNDNFPLEFARGLFITAMDEIYVSGDTGASDFPVTHTLPGLPCAADGLGDADIFVAKYTTAGARLFTTCFGGTSRDAGRGIGLDPAGNIFVAGWTRSSDMPATAGTAQPLYGGGDTDGYIARLNASATTLDFVTYVGGSDVEFLESLVLDSAGNAYVSGSSLSVDFPVTPGALQTVFGGSDGVFNYGDVVIAKLLNAGADFDYATYYGGSGDEIAWSLLLAPGNKVLMAGTTSSVDLPLAAPVQATNAGGTGDVFAAMLDDTGSTLEFGTYLGGTSGEFLSWGLARDDAGTIYLAGNTESVDFPVASPYQGANAGFIDGFIAKLAPDPVAEADLSVSKHGLPPLARRGETITYTILATNHAAGPATGVLVIDRLPSHFNLVSAAAERGGCTDDGHREVICDLGTLNGGETLTVTITGTSGRRGMLVNSVEIEGDQPDPRRRNNRAIALNFIWR